MTGPGTTFRDFASGREKADHLLEEAFKVRNSNYKLASQMASDALDLSRKCHYQKGEADSLNLLGFVSIHKADNENAFSMLFDALSIYEQLGDEAGIAAAKYNLGMLHLRMGVFSQSIPFLNESLELRMRLGDRSGMAACYFQMTYVSQHFNDLDLAEEQARKAIELRREAQDDAGLAAALMVLGEIFMKRKDLRQAKETLEQSLHLRKKGNEKMGYFATLLRWAELHMELHEFGEARTYVEEGLMEATNEEVRFGVIRFLQMLARIEIVAGNIPAAKKACADALAFAERYSFKSIEYELLEVMADIAKKEGDFRTALDFHERFHRLKEEVISLQTNTQLKSVQFMNQIAMARKEADIEKTKNAELAQAYNLIADKNKEILDSIQYAKRIQSSLLPTEKYLQRIFSDLSKRK